MRVGQRPGCVNNEPGETLMKKQYDTGQKTEKPFPKPAATHQTTLSLEARIAAIVSAPPEILHAIDSLLTGKQLKPEPTSLKLYRVGEVSKLTGRSRVSIWRAMTEGRLRTVKLYDRGVNLIPESEIIKLIGGGA